MARTSSSEPVWQTAFVVVAIAAIAAFVVGGVLLAVTLPYHEFDSFGFGEWSRQIASGRSLDPLTAGEQSATRPLFYELQGALWAVTGVSFAAGRLLSLAFALIFVGGVLAAQRALDGSILAVAVTGAVAVAVPTLTEQALSGQTDVPAAALVALVAALALRRSLTLPTGLALAAAAAVAVLAKQTVLLALVPLTLLLMVEAGRRRDAWLRGPAGFLAAGLALGIAYDTVMAVRFGTDLVTLLRVGSDGYWAELARAARHDVFFRADVLGSGLRLPLLFGLVYAVARVTGVRHRIATPIALVLGLAWSIAGPLIAHVPNGAFAKPEDGFALVGFAVVLAAAALVPDDEAPARRMLAIPLVMSLPALAEWVLYSGYTYRLASAAWPGLCLLTGCVITVGLRGLARGGAATALAPAAVLALVVWTSLAGFDGLHGSMWAEYRALGWSGLGDKMRTMHVVLPATQSALAAAEPALGDGRLVTGDPTFPFFLPGRVDTRTPQKCADVAGEKVFVLLTGDESIQFARRAGALATPEEWARCTRPRLQQLSDGSNGFAVFAVSPS